jgi:hypothetical protein
MKFPFYWHYITANMWYKITWQPSEHYYGAPWTWTTIIHGFPMPVVGQGLGNHHRIMYWNGLLLAEPSYSSTMLPTCHTDCPPVKTRVLKSGLFQSFLFFLFFLFFFDFLKLLQKKKLCHVKVGIPMRKYFWSGPDRTTFFSCSKPPLSWHNFFYFAVASMVQKLQKDQKRLDFRN